MRYRHRSAAARYAAAERRAQAERDAGIPDRPPDQRQPWDIDLRAVGGPCWHCEPRTGYVSYRVTDVSGQRVMCGPPKRILAAAQDITPRVLSMRSAAA